MLPSRQPIAQTRVAGRIISIFAPTAALFRQRLPDAERRGKSLVFAALEACTDLDQALLDELPGTAVVRLLRTTAGAAFTAVRGLIIMLYGSALPLGTSTRMGSPKHACGVAALYHLPGRGTSPLAPLQGAEEISRLMPRMLLDLQHRGQLAAGFTTYNPRRKQLIDTYKQVGTVAEAFRLNHTGKFESIMSRYAGRAAIGHVRYATCGLDERSYAQPFERHHLQKTKWFSFAFNGQLANYQELRQQILEQDEYHLSRDTDTEIILHLISRELAGAQSYDLRRVFSSLARQLDGAYNLVFLNALGDMVVARDPLGFRPLCWAQEGPLLAAASESVALFNLGFQESSIKSLEPGTAVIIQKGEVREERFAESPLIPSSAAEFERGVARRRAHCFFEWIYFAHVASSLDERSVYLSRTRLGEELAALEDVALDSDTIVVPVPDTAKAAADAMAFKLGVPSREGLIRNRYVGRTFIEGRDRAAKAKLKYTPQAEVLRGKRVLLVEDTIVRSTTMKVLVNEMRRRGGAREVHVRVACPPIVAPCFYGIDMSTVTELFAPRFAEEQGSGVGGQGAGRAETSPLAKGGPVGGGRALPYGELSQQTQRQMARELGADSLRYLPLAAIARAVGLPAEALCRACITGDYPTPAGQRLYAQAKADAEADANGDPGCGYHRTYDTAEAKRSAAREAARVR